MLQKEISERTLAEGRAVHDACRRPPISEQNILNQAEQRLINDW